MRVIAGKARRTPLKCVEGLSTRPTTDRIKETLFNMINSDIYDCLFLDLFSGSGGIGIEALSRGAGTVWFVDNDRRAVDCIRQNLEKTRLLDSAVVMPADALSAIGRLEENSEKMDIIFMDPPYGKLLEKEVLKRLSASPVADNNTQIIVEAAVAEDFSYAEALGFDILKEKIYKTNKHIFLKKREYGDKA